MIIEQLEVRKSDHESTQIYLIEQSGEYKTVVENRIETSRDDFLANPLVMNEHGSDLQSAKKDFEALKKRFM